MDNVEKDFLNYCIENEIDSSYNMCVSLREHCIKDSGFLNDEFYLNCMNYTSNYYDFIGELGLSWGVDAFKILNNFRGSTYSKYKRLVTRVENLLNCNENEKACFLTFTFDNTSIDIDPKKSRKHLVTVLKKFAISYVANEDYGSLKERFHYHALVKVPVNFHVTDYLVKYWDYGFIYVEDIKFKNRCSIATYLNKLTKHAKKFSNKRQCIIYSRA